MYFTGDYLSQKDVCDDQWILERGICFKIVEKHLNWKVMISCMQMSSNLAEHIQLSCQQCHCFGSSKRPKLGFFAFTQLGL